MCRGVKEGHIPGGGGGGVLLPFGRGVWGGGDWEVYGYFLASSVNSDHFGCGWRLRIVFHIYDLFKFCTSHFAERKKGVEVADLSTFLEFLEMCPLL